MKCDNCLNNFEEKDIFYMLPTEIVKLDENDIVTFYDKNHRPFTPLIKVCRGCIVKTINYYCEELEIKEG
jgi:hypothetical protein